jgi:hypothetical protein
MEHFVEGYRMGVTIWEELILHNGNIITVFASLETTEHSTIIASLLHIPRTHDPWWKTNE